MLAKHLDSAKNQRGFLGIKNSENRCFLAFSVFLPAQQFSDPVPLLNSLTQRETHNDLTAFIPIFHKCF